MREIKVSVLTGLEARAAAVLVQTAGRFKSSVTLKSGEKTANAKSIMGVLSLSILEGQDITVITTGEDEDIAARQIGDYFNSIKAGMN